MRTDTCYGSTCMYLCHGRTLVLLYSGSPRTRSTQLVHREKLLKTPHFGGKSIGQCICSSPTLTLSMWCADFLKQELNSNALVNVTLPPPWRNVGHKWRFVYWTSPRGWGFSKFWLCSFIVIDKLLELKWCSSGGFDRSSCPTGGAFCLF